MNYVCSYHYVIKDKFSFVSIVGENSANLSRRKKDICRSFFIKESLSIFLSSEIEFPARSHYKVIVTFCLKLSDNCRAYKPSMAGYIYFIFFVHIPDFLELIPLRKGGLRGLFDCYAFNF